MAVLPGSLDYLYYNGILDHIPYEAYEMGPVTQSGMMQMSGMGTGYGFNPMMQGYGTAAPMMPQMNGSQYLQAAQRGLLYGTDVLPDTFHRINTTAKTGDNFSIVNKAFSDGEGYSRDVDYEVMANGQDGKNFRIAIMDAASKAKETVSNSPNWVKGILAAGVMITTLCCLVKGKKPVKIKK